MGSTTEAFQLQENIALLVIDMQNAAVHPGGTFAKLGFDMKTMQAIVPPIVRLVEAFQKKNLATIFVKMGWAPDYSDAGLLVTHAGGAAIKSINGYIRGTWDTELISSLQPYTHHPKAIEFDKTRNSSFHSTNLKDVLRENGVTQVVVTGGLTNACVEGTVRDGFSDGFHCVVPKEATAAVDERVKEASLTNMVWWADVVGVEDVLGALER